MRAVLRAHDLHRCLAASAALAIAGLSWRALSVSLPFLASPVPVPTLVAVATSALVLVPLYSRFGILARTFARERLMRPVRLAAATVIGAFAFAPAATTDGLWLLMTLAAAGVLATVVVGEFAWAVSLLAGFTAMFVDTGISRPVARILERWGPMTGIATILLAFVAYVLWGPRASRDIEQPT